MTTHHARTGSIPAPRQPHARHQAPEEPDTVVLRLAPHRHPAAAPEPTASPRRRASRLPLPAWDPLPPG